MPSKSETGHIENVDNFKTLIAHIESYGSAYKPFKRTIQLPTLKKLLTSCQNALSNVNQSLSDYNLAMSKRKKIYYPLNKFITRVTKSLKLSGAPLPVYRDAMELSHKIKGEKMSIKRSTRQMELLVAKGKLVKETSVLQMDFNNRVDSFDELIKLLQEIYQYDPSEDELKIQSLKQYFTVLKEANDNVVTLASNLESQRAIRDELLYMRYGLLAAVTDINSYLLSALGRQSPIYKQIKKIKFIARKVI